MSTLTPANTKGRGTAVITGASAGLGSAFAERFARRGHDLLLIARRGDRLESLAATLRAQHGVQVKTLVADLRQPAELARVAQSIADDTSISVLVNNAGMATFGPIATTNADAAAAMVDLNITALTRLSLAVLPRFKHDDRGTIINVGSVLGFHATPGSGIYSGTKSYVLTFTRSLQEEVAGSGVRVQLVAPAATATEIWELAGVPVTHLPQGTVMSIDDCVDAAMAGLDQGELITTPSIEDVSLLGAYDTARLALFGGGRSDRPASRYAVGS